MTKSDLLLQSAARLYALGVDLEGAREEVRRLADSGVAMDSPRMLAACGNFLELKEQWEALEREHLKLRDTWKAKNI